MDMQYTPTIRYYRAVTISNNMDDSHQHNVEHKEPSNNKKTAIYYIIPFI